MALLHLLESGRAAFLWQGLHRRGPLCRNARRPSRCARQNQPPGVGFQLTFLPTFRRHHRKPHWTLFTTTWLALRLRATTSCQTLTMPDSTKQHRGGFPIGTRFITGCRPARPSLQQRFDFSGRLHLEPYIDNSTADFLSTALLPVVRRISRTGTPRDRSPLSRTHRFTLAAVYDLKPTSNRANWIMRNIVGNWASARFIPTSLRSMRRCSRPPTPT